MPAQEIPYDEMRAILGLPDLPQTTPYQPHRRFEHGDRLVCETVDGAQYSGIIVDVVEHGDEVSYKLEDPRYSARAQNLAVIRDRALGGDLAAKVEHALAVGVIKLAADLSEVPVTHFPRPEPDSRTPRERALPRPSHTPPPWAQDPARTRRTKNGGIDMRTPRV
ncbi:hypothetical protein P9990_17655 [Prescottella equi]|uniref:hypothetical protein n=1 Tax=Rhodococcus hoagii TaxID=43767 RepID=UPI00257880DE|nr:hypothetical protein [Prescottella equi]WJJ10398.1 hypothetical protein P9990_17655 [Prescottella equi]